MATKSFVKIELSAEMVELFDRYHRYTATSPEAYIEELVDKTKPTLQAMVEAMDEASENPENSDVMAIFSEKMALAALAQKQSEQEALQS